MTDTPRYILGLKVLAALAVIAASVVTIWVQFRPVQPTSGTLKWRADMPADLVSLAEAPLIGSETAPYTMIVFSDFECPFCAKFATDTWPRLQEQLVKTGKLRVAFRHVPIESLHSFAIKAAEAAACAAKVGRFWEFHDELFRRTVTPNHQKPTEAVLMGVASHLHLDDTLFGNCLRGETTGRVRADLTDARRLGVNSTPRFFLGKTEESTRLRVTEVLRGAKPLAEFVAAIARLEGRPITTARPFAR